MNRYAISFTVKPGSKAQVAEILRSYRRPASAAAAGGPPLLRRTSVFLAGQRVVRVMDVDGDLTTVMRHLAAQPQIRAVEAALDPHLATPRDLDSSEGVRAFLHQALLPPVPRASTPPPDVEADRAGSRYGLLYPVRSGQGKQAAQVLAGISAELTVFHRADVVVGIVEADASADEALDQVARDASRAPTIPALAGALATDADLTTETGFRRFLDDCQMELLTDRRVGVPA